MRAVSFGLIVLMLYHTFSMVYEPEVSGSWSNHRLFSVLGLHHQDTPLIHLRIGRNSEVLNSTKVEPLGTNYVRINGHLFNLVSLGVYEHFLDLRLVLNEPCIESGAQKNLVDYSAAESNEEESLEGNSLFLAVTEISLAKCLPMDYSERNFFRSAVDTNDGYINIAELPPAGLCI